MNGRVRLLLSIADLSGGGAERELLTLAGHLPRERFETHLLLHRPVFTHPPPPGLPIHLLRRGRPWHTPASIGGIRRAIERLRPQVVFSQLHYVNLLTGSALARARHRPRWVCRHTGDPRRELRGPLVPWARRAIARADRVVGCCDGVRDALREHLHLEPGHVETLPNAVDVERVTALSREPLAIRRDPGVFNVVHAARFVPQKNQALLIDAFAALGERPAALWMLGDGPLRAPLEARARELGVAGRVHWLGFRPNPYPFFRAADAFALSSDHEGLPNAVIEAALCGTPAVATRCRYGPEELIEAGATGALVPVGDVRAFAAALAALAGDRDATQRMGARARERCARRFDTDTVCASYARLFERLARE